MYAQSDIPAVERGHTDIDGTYNVVANAPVESGRKTSYAIHKRIHFRQQPGVSTPADWAIDRWRPALQVPPLPLPSDILPPGK